MRRRDDRELIIYLERARSMRVNITQITSCLMLTISLSLFQQVFKLSCEAKTTNPEVTSREAEGRRKALSLLRSGQELFAQKDYLKAIQSWREAYSLFPDQKLLYYIAKAYEQLGDRCEDEERAWSAYFVECARGDCYHHQDALSQREKFSKRCYVEVRFVSNAEQTKIKFFGQSHQLPHQQKMLKRDYEKFKVSAPHHLSEWIELELTKLSRDDQYYEVRVMLTPLPHQGFVGRHKWKFTLGTAISGVALMSLGSLKLSDAIAKRNEMDSELKFIDAFPTEEDQLAVNHGKRKASFESDRAWGVGYMVVGGALLGTSIWLFVREDPNQELFNRARRQGDLSAIESWRLTPLVGPSEVGVSLTF